MSPKRCSGLDTVAYGEAAIQGLFTAFRLLDSHQEAHLTPQGKSQAFHYFRLERLEPDQLSKTSLKH
ncbi:MAG: hypothetical protein R2865_03025 [Deinococcales bacterium]